MIKLTRFNQTDGITELTSSELKDWNPDSEQVLFVDIVIDNSEEQSALLSRIFPFHALTLEDAFKYDKEENFHFPKIEDFEDYVFIVFNSLSNIKKTRYKIQPVSIYVGKNYLVLIRSKAESLEVLQRFTSDKSLNIFKRGPDYLLHLILDEIVDKFYPVIDAFEDEIDTIEETIFKKDPSNLTLMRILNLKKNMMKLRRLSVSQKEILYKLSHSVFDVISVDEAAYYRNVYDHLLRVSETLDSYRDLLTSILDSYLSIINNKLNEVIKVLTIFATIMLPLNLISGIYGMNFDYIPFLHNQLGFFSALGFMLIVVIVMLLWFRRKRWV